MNKSPILFGSLAVAVLIGGAGIAVGLNQQKTPTSAPTPEKSTVPAASSTPATSMTPTASDAASGTSELTAITTFKAGAYTVMGGYTSPAGPETIRVSLTIAEDGTIQESKVEPQTSHPISKRWQQTFTDNYKEKVIGKNIKDLVVDVTSGSSLTPKGFNDAVMKIRQQAAS